MATLSWTTAAPQTSDADFRAWGLELSTQLQAMNSTPGLVKTADTGQIDWGTVTRPGASTDAGYEIYYLNDSLHATAPIYFKIHYGSHGSNTYPRLRVEVGTSSNGGGTLGGIGSGSVRTLNLSGTTITTPHPSYLCVNTGFVGLSWKTTAPGAGFAICRTCDNDGTPNGKGAMHIYGGGSGGNASEQCLRYESVAAAQTASTSGGISLVVGDVSSSIAGANTQVYSCWGHFPDVRPMFGFASVLLANFPLGSTFSVPMVGSTSRTFITTGESFQSPEPNKTSSECALAMLWE